jgi:hypothetical protein
LDRTDHLTPAAAAAGWWEALRAGVGVGAAEGWPARLTSRWIAEIFRKTPLGRCRPPATSALPEPCGALSFGRALAGWGVRLLDDAREQAEPFATHQHPTGTRRHVRFALFASMVAEQSFARRVLGLSTEGARSHRRAVAAALLHSLRIEAWRVAVGDALRAGEEPAAVDTYVSVGARALGTEPATALLGVLPELRATDGAALVGYLLAATKRREVIARFDEDWFHNPRVAEWLHDEDRAHRYDEVIPATAVDEAIEHCVADLTDALA